MTFSIITITYNSESYLEQTIRSVLTQDYTDFEYLLVDGQSNDKTLDIIRQYAAKDGRIRWISEPDKGIADAMNKGIALATGEIVAHLHSDDFYPDPGVLLSVAEAFEKDLASLWLTGGVCVVDDRGQTLDTIRVRDYSYRKLIENNMILHPATFVRRQAFELAGRFDPALKYAMDYDLWLRLGALCDPLRLDRTLASFRAHPGSLSTAGVDAAFDEAWAVRKKYLGGNPFRLLRHYRNYRRSRKVNRDYITNLGMKP